MKKSEIALFVIGGLLVILLVLSFLGIDILGEITGQAPAISRRNCVDTEDGIDKYTKGTVEYGIAGQATKTYGDVCSETGNQVREYYCDGRARLKFRVFACTNGCTDGACIESAE